MLDTMYWLQDRGEVQGLRQSYLGYNYKSCNVGHDVTADRMTSKAGIHGSTNNNHSVAAVWVRGGHGTIIDGGFWSENADGAAGASTIKIGQTSGVDGATSSTTAYDCEIIGPAKIHPDEIVGQDELIHLIRAVGFEQSANALD